MARKTIEERFNAKVRMDADGCHRLIACTNSKGYGYFWDGTRPVFAHRWAYSAAHGEIPKGMDIDHMCWNKECVNVEHLRITTRKQNLENVSALQGNNTSGYQGVTWHKHARKWCARIKHNGKRIHVGYFDDINEANDAVIEARNKHFTHNDLDRAS